MDKLIELYTDGACSQNGSWDGGWAYVAVRDGEEESYESGFLKNTTNNVMEMTAFINALKHVSQYSGWNIKVYSDSAYILNCFSQKWYVKWKQNGWMNAKKEPVANKELWIDLFFYYDFVSKKNKIELIKVKGHSGNQFNERADQLAVAALKRGK